MVGGPQGLRDRGRVMSEFEYLYWVNLAGDDDFQVPLEWLITEFDLRFLKSMHICLGAHDAAETRKR